MAEDLPMACALGGSDLRRRYLDLARFGEANLIARSTNSEGEELRFRHSPENEHRLRSIVAAEAECCPFLDLALTERDGELVLRIGGAADALPIAAGLAAAFG
ncbi:MAG TPA: hypothetical protein VN522_15060 [Solirubrobacterales bacterium]|nr:hypothetical protein [Solirubrobacterales bacterium]